MVQFVSYLRRVLFFLHITSLADVSFHIVAYMLTCTRGFGILEKIRCGLRFFGVFLCGFAVFGPPLRPTPPAVPLKLLHLKIALDLEEIKNT